jgi:hypothetical protein
MPLLFRSLSHGDVAFGFYNIETDGLLLDRYFFFSTDFCQAVQTLAAASARQAAAVSLAGHEFPDPAGIGDLMGAIHGVRFTGYLGEVYRRWPFPKDPRAFRQKLNCAENRAPTLALLDELAVPVTIKVAREPGFRRVAIGPYRFSRNVFGELLRYVVRGGHPTWEGYEEGRMPAAVRPLLGVLDQLQS